MSNKYDFESWQIEFFDDKLLMQIFLSLRDTPKSVKQICHENNVPMSSVYRKLKKLQKRGLIEKSGIISDEGVKTFLYSRESKVA